MNNRNVAYTALLCLVLLQTVISEENGEVSVSQAHRNILEMVFKEVDKLSTDGIITVDDAINALDQLPFSISADGTTSEEQSVINLIKDLEKDGVIDGKLTLEEFINSQASLSDNVSDNGLFYRLVRRRWH